MRILIKEHKDREINIKVRKGFNVVRSIMPTSTDEREYSTILENFGVSKYCDE